MKHFPITLLSWILASALLFSCGGDEPIDPIPAVDTMAPTITVSMNSVNIIAEPSVTISGDALKIGNDAVASWKDDVSKSCKVELSLTPAGGSVKDVHSGDKLSEEGKLQIKATDDAGNSSTADITLTKADTKAPEIEVKIPEKNVIAGVEVKIEGNQLFFDSEVAASWKDDYSETFNVELSIAGKKINSGDVLFDAGTLVLSVADEFQNKATAEITLTSVAIYGLENLQGKTLQVDQEVNLLEGLTITEGLTLTKVEIEENGTRNEVAEPKTYTPEYPGTVNIILTLARPDGSTIEVRVDNLTVKRLDYHAISLTDIKPVDVFPQIAQIEGGDPNIYSYVEDLRVAEAYVMREMMTEYGVGKYGPEEYQQLLSRVIIGLIEEKPDDYENYEWIWPSYEANVSDHGNTVFKHLLSLKWNYTDIMNLSGSGEGWATNLLEYAKSHPDCLFMFSNSSTKVAYSQSEYKQEVFDQNVISLCDLPNVIIYIAWGDTKIVAGVNLRIIYNGVYDEVNWEWRYLYSSMANSDKNNYPNSNMRIVLWTNPQWNPDMTNSQGSLFPIGFDDGAIVSGRPILPIFRYWRFWTDELPRNWSYLSSYVTPTIASETQLIFGLHADVKDADELLEMIESSLSDPDHISLNGQRQALQKYSPANFVKKYCLTTIIPSNIGLGENVTLTKEWYKGLVYDIPGAEVKIGDEWIAYDAKNRDLILGKNPMGLEWRINGTLLRKLGYVSGQTVQGRILSVDDQWKGLRMEVPFEIQFK